MKTLTSKIQPTRRLEIYKAMLAFMERREKELNMPYQNGFCFALKLVKKEYEPPMFQNLSKYPELRQYRPAERSYKLKHTGYWFERGTFQGAEIRKKILREIIEEMKLNNNPYENSNHTHSFGTH